MASLIASKKQRQQKAGIPAKKRGQQMGQSSGSSLQEGGRSHEKLALRGRLKKKNRMFADKSSQEIGSSPAMARTNSPSTTAVNTGGQPGETTGETVFKRRLQNRKR